MGMEYTGRGHAGTEICWEWDAENGILGLVLE